MTEDKVRTFGFSTQTGADLFIARLDKRAYARVKDGEDIRIGDFKVKREGDQLAVLVFPMSPKEFDSLSALASQDRAKAGEPKRPGGKVIDATWMVPTVTKRQEPPKPAPKVSKMKKRAASAAKADVDRKAARSGALAHLTATTKATPVLETPPQVREENQNSPVSLAALIADCEARRDRLQKVIEHLRSAEAAMAEVA